MSDINQSEYFSQISFHEVDQLKLIHLLQETYPELTYNQCVNVSETFTTFLYNIIEEKDPRLKKITEEFRERMNLIRERHHLIEG